MNPVTIRPYRGGDEADIVSLWNRACPKDGIDLTTFVRRVLCDPNFDPEGCLVAQSDAGLVGFLLAIVRRVPMFGSDLEPEHGWITAFGVDPVYRRQGIATQLFNAADSFFQAHNRRIISFAPYAPNYFVPGIDRETYPEGAAFLDRRGYQRLYTCVAMDRSLVLYEVPEDVREAERALLNEGYRFEPLSPSIVAETIRFAHEAFHADWGRAVREAILKGAPNDQFMVAINPAGNIVGFAMFGGYDGIAERFGPFGVDDSQRGKGLGKVLLYKILEVMRSKGLHGCWFLWTGERSPAGHLYYRAGFTVTRRFDVMKREYAG